MLPSSMRSLGSGHKRMENSPDQLHTAVLTGRSKKIKHLLKKGVHIESVNSLGQTPLFCASYGGDYEIVELLLNLGANPNRRCGAQGAAPIHAASYRGSRRVLRLLVNAGARIGLRDTNFQLPKDYAEKQPNILRRQKVLEFLDLLYEMTMHERAGAPLLTTDDSFETESNASTLRSVGPPRLRGFFGGSQLSLARKHSQSNANIWSSCISEVSSSDASEVPKDVVVTEDLQKNVSFHLLDQLCVTTSLPLLSPDQLEKSNNSSPAYTCGGPTVYSAYSWIGTPVTVRRPTPALSLNKRGEFKEHKDKGLPDGEAVQSLLQELSFLRRLRHPGFLEVMAACHISNPSPEHVTLVYQNVTHGSLYHHLHVQHHDLSVGVAVDILVGLVEALLFMHAHGWFHCGLSSHSVHLVNATGAKLGGFEHVLERKVKGVGMKANHLARATWLAPWQAPESIIEKMVSVKSEVYSLTAIIWEIWAGMPPWYGVEEEEVLKRVASGENLPPLTETSLSLVSYLTQYGLKWHEHEREIDLQEVHTMLRSLRIQCNEEERVPAVPSWGPPSVPNTPVIGRHSTNSELSDSERSKEASSVECKKRPVSLSLENKVLNFKPRIFKPSSQGRLSPTKFKTMTLGALNRRPLSVSSDYEGILKHATLPAKSKGPRHRTRRSRKKQDLEFEEEFIDDEFNSMLFDAPHLQLSIGSSDNLVDSRLSFSLVDDSASSSSLNIDSQTASSSEDDSLRHIEDSGKAKEKVSDDNKPPDRLKDIVSTKQSSPQTFSESETDEVFNKKHVLKANLQKNLTNYLPTYSIGSDSD